MRVEVVVSRVLFWGGILSIVLMVLGVVGYAARTIRSGDVVNFQRLVENREHARSAEVFVSLDAIGKGLRQRPIDPVGVSALGIVLLLLTPGARRDDSYGGFLGRRRPSLHPDRRHRTRRAPRQLPARRLRLISRRASRARGRGRSCHATSIRRAIR